MSRLYIVGSYRGTLQKIFFFYSIASMTLGALATMAPVADQFQRALQTSTFCNRLYCFFNKRWFFDQVLNDFLVRLFLHFGYSVSFKALDKGAIEIAAPCSLRTLLP